MTIFVSREEIREYARLKIISELSKVKTRLQLFGSKYNCSFEEFEKLIHQDTKEDFEKWDDYIDWKASHKRKEALRARMDEVENAKDIRIIEDS